MTETEPTPPLNRDDLAQWVYDHIEWASGPIEAEEFVDELVERLGFTHKMLGAIAAIIEVEEKSNALCYHDNKREIRRLAIAAKERIAALLPPKEDE